MRDQPRRSPPARDRVFHVHTASPRTVLRLQSWVSDAGSDEPRTLEGRELPRNVGAVVEGGSLRILCTGPGDWLVAQPVADVSRLRNVLAPELTRCSLALADLTRGLTVLEMSGSAVREVLARSCSLDVDPRRFAAGRCARTRFAQLPVVLDCKEDSGIFELYVATSYAQFLNAWLSDAAQGIS